MQPCIAVLACLCEPAGLYMCQHMGAVATVASCKHGLSEPCDPVTVSRSSRLADTDTPKLQQSLAFSILPIAPSGNTHTYIVLVTTCNYDVSVSPTRPCPCHSIINSTACSGRNNGFVAVAVLCCVHHLPLLMIPSVRLLDTVECA
jgi:hypothetical protein